MSLSADNTRERRKKSPQSDVHNKLKTCKENASNVDNSNNDDKENATSSKDGENSKQKPYRYGPMPKFSSHRLWTKTVLFFGVMIYVWYQSDTKETALAKRDTTYAGRGQKVKCSEEYLNDLKNFVGCLPNECGRYVSDKIVTHTEVKMLLKLAKRGMALTGGSSGGATIMDLHSGALSYGDKFVNFYKSPNHETIVTTEDIAVYKIVRNKIQRAIAEFFQIDVDSLYLTHPTFFSRLTNIKAHTKHDEYWHVHVDKRTYGSFHYTSLLYLNDYGKDFEGGRFVFVDSADAVSRHNVTVEPRKGRVSMFTSGAENPHFVEKVLEGERFAITVSFTCDKTKAIDDNLVN